METMNITYGLRKSCSSNPNYRVLLREYGWSPHWRATELHVNLSSVGAHALDGLKHPLPSFPLAAAVVVDTSVYADSTLLKDELSICCISVSSFSLKIQKPTQLTCRHEPEFRRLRFGGLRSNT